MHTPDTGREGVWDPKYIPFTEAYSPTFTLLPVIKLLETRLFTWKLRL